MNFITKLFNGTIDEYVHSQFIRYSVGEYEPKAVVVIKNGPTARIVTSFEYVNDFIGLIGEHAKGELAVNGKIFLKQKIETPFSLEKKKGYFMADVNCKTTPKQLKEWADAYGQYGYLLLNLKGEGIELKTKATPHNPKGKYGVKFCKAIVSGSLKDVFLRDIVFEGGNFKEAKIKHQFVVIDVIIPKEYENDMALARVHGKRKVKIIRTVVLDGVETKREKEFIA